MTKQSMILPLNCEAHSHAGYGSSKDHPCPWCEIERLERYVAALEGQLDSHGLKAAQREAGVVVEPERK